MTCERGFTSACNSNYSLVYTASFQNTGDPDTFYHQSAEFIH